MSCFGLPNLRGVWRSWLIPALLLLVGSGCGCKKSDVPTDRFSALGKVMAENTVQLSHGKGSVVLLVSTNDYHQSTAYGVAIDSFVQTLGSSIAVTGIEILDTPKMLGPGSEPLPMPKFAELLQKYSSADFLVSFVGVPPMNREQIARLPSPRPKVVVVVMHNPPIKAMFAGQLLSLAAMAKPGLQDAAVGGSAQEIFDDCYQLVTPETSGLLPK